MGVHFAAGILPVTWYEGIPLFLIGKDIRDGTFSDFGGKCERYDRNDPITTACREMYEETYGTVLGTKQVRTRMTPKTSVLLKSTTQNGYPYYMFVVQVPYMPHLRNTFHKALAFLKTKNMNRMYVEKTDIQWVTLGMLKNIPKRTVFANTLQRHAAFLEKLGTCPSHAWRDMCTNMAPQFDLSM